MGADFSYIVPVVALVTVLVAVHEWGHYIVARMLGVDVRVFSIGFGPELLGWSDRHGTRWRVSLFPIGGYVRFAENAGEEPRPGTFQSRPPLARAAIIVSGPAGNLIFALGMLALVYGLIGVPATPPVVGMVRADGPAWQAGLRPGDRIAAIGGEEVPTFEAVQKAVVLAAGRPLPLSFQRDGTAIETAIVPRSLTVTDSAGLQRRQGDLGAAPAFPAVVGSVLPGGGGALAGLAAGDRVLAIDGIPVRFFHEIQEAVRRSGGAPLVFTVERDGFRMERTVIPAAAGESWVAGINRPAAPRRPLAPGPALAEAARASLDLLRQTARHLGEMIDGQRGFEEISGPVRVVQFSAEAYQHGIEQFVVLAALISLNLGVVNLFPLPALDGGHLVFLALEAARCPLSPRAVQRMQQAGLFALLAFMVVVTANDVAETGLLKLLGG